MPLLTVEVVATSCINSALQALCKHQGDPYEDRLQLAQLRYVTSSDAAATLLAENYVGPAWR